jgi:hypothetical protein
MQKFLEVWKDNQLWYEFPAENEDNVRAFLMKSDLDRVCEIKSKVENVEVLKTNVAAQTTVVELPSPTPKKQTTPKAVKATNK